MLLNLRQTGNPVSVFMHFLLWSGYSKTVSDESSSENLFEFSGYLCNQADRNRMAKSMICHSQNEDTMASNNIPHFKTHKKR